MKIPNIQTTSQEVSTEVSTSPAVAALIAEREEHLRAEQVQSQATVRGVLANVAEVPDQSTLLRIQETFKQEEDGELGQLMQDILGFDGPGVNPETQAAFDRAKQRGWK